MDVVFLAIVLLGLTAFVAAPLYGRARPSGPTQAPDDRKRSEALTDELEVDRASGLITESEYRQERAALDSSD